MSSIVEWANPSPKSRPAAGRKSTYGEALAALRQHPGKWARITPEPLDGTKAQSHAARIRNGLVADAAPGEFDATDDQSHLFVKYVGADGIRAWHETKAKREANREKRRATLAEAGITDDGNDDADGFPDDDADGTEDDARDTDGNASGDDTPANAPANAAAPQFAW